MEGTLKRTAVLITVSVLSLAAIFLFVGSNDINRHAIAQPTTQTPFPNNTETIGELDKLLGNNTAVIFNDTNIGAKNTANTSIGENLLENCMKLPNTNHYYCP
jgi:hypothetical protein